MRRNRFIVITALLAVFAMVLVGCGDGGGASSDDCIIRFAFSPDPAWDWIVDEGILEEMEAESGCRIIQSITWDELSVFAGGHADIVSIGSYETPIVETETDVATVTIGKFNLAKDVVIVANEQPWNTLADLPAGCTIGVESFVGGATVWAALADAMHGRELGEGSADLPMGTADYQIMPDLVADGEFCGGIIDPTQAIPYLADQRVKTLYDGKAGSELYGENFMPGHEGMTSNNFVTLKSWYEDHPDEVAFFLEVWQRSMDEWAANRELIIDTYPEHFAVETPDQIDFIKDYFVSTFDWFVDSPYIDEAWIEGEKPITEILRDAKLVDDEQEFPIHVCIDPATGEETCREP